jgi:hypothetical protein
MPAVRHPIEMVRGVPIVAAPEEIDARHTDGLRVGPGVQARACSRLVNRGITWSIPVIEKIRRTLASEVTSRSCLPSASACLCARTKT